MMMEWRMSLVIIIALMVCVPRPGSGVELRYADDAGVATVNLVGADLVFRAQLNQSIDMMAIGVSGTRSLEGSEIVIGIPDQPQAQQFLIGPGGMEEQQMVELSSPFRESRTSTVVEYSLPMDEYLAQYEPDEVSWIPCSS